MPGWFSFESQDSEDKKYIYFSRDSIALLSVQLYNFYNYIRIFIYNDHLK